jgi:hypothetical protein
MTETILTRSSTQINFIQNPNLTPLQSGVDILVSGFAERATDGYSLAAMMAGGWAYRIGRLSTLAVGSRFVNPQTLPLASQLLRLSSVGVGFAGEVLTFEAGQRALRVGIGGADARLLQWGGENGLGRGLVGAAITLGSLKSAGFAVQGQNVALQHLFQDSAMVLAHNASASLGVGERSQDSLAQQMVNAEATLLQMNAGMALVGMGTGGRLLSMERAADLKIRSFSSGARNPSSFPLSLTPATALSTSGEAALGPVSAVDQGSEARSLNVFMVGEADSSSQGGSSVRENTRVNGPVLEILGRKEPTSQVPAEGFLGRMENPENGFDPFKFPDGSQVVWIEGPSAYPSPLNERLATTWNNALGAVLVANPQMDALGLIVMHGAMKNHWAPDAAGSSPVWRGLGGMMAFPKAIPPSRDLHPLLNYLGIASSEADFDLTRLSPEHQAFVNLLGAAEKVNGKALGMTPKWRFIDQALEGIGLTTRTGLGGMKSVVLHAPNDAAKEQAVRMMAQVARTLGIYISGGDEGTARGPWTDIFAEIAPMNMGGSKNSHPLLQGHYPSEYTAQGVFAGLQHYLREEFTDPRRAPIFFQGTGGVGGHVIRFALDHGYSVSGVTEIKASDLVKMRDQTREQGFRDISFIWDRRAAREALDSETFEKEKAIAEAEGLFIADDLVESLQLASRERTMRGLASRIPILSLNATSHQVSIERLEEFRRLGVQAIIGGANNMLELDDQGSYLPTALQAVQLGINIPNDSALNRMGATIVLANALGINDAQAAALAEWVGAYSFREFQLGHLKGIPPQVYSDRIAHAAWDHLLDLGEAKGGRFGKR